MDNNQTILKPNDQYAFCDFFALMHVVRKIALPIRRLAIPRGRLQVGAAYSLFICSIGDAIARIISDNNESLANTTSGIPRLPSLASLTRQLLEAYALFFFFSIQPESKDEANFRFFIANLHAAYDERRAAQSHVEELNRIKDSGNMEASPEEHQKQLNDAMEYKGERTKLIKQLKKELKLSPFLTVLCSECQLYWKDPGLDISKGFGAFRDAVFKKVGLGKHIRGIEYDMLSSFVHAAPSSLKRTFEKLPGGVGIHVRYAHLWSGCLAQVIRYLLKLLPSDDESVSASERTSIAECCDHYAQFLEGIQLQGGVIVSQDKSNNCPTCWLRKTAMREQ